MESKKLIQSKVLWFNVLSIGSVALTTILASPEMKETLGEYAPMIMIAGAVINAVLRQYTTVPLNTATPAPKNDTN